MKPGEQILKPEDVAGVATSGPGYLVVVFDTMVVDHGSGEGAYGTTTTEPITRLYYFPDEKTESLKLFLKITKTAAVFRVSGRAKVETRIEVVIE